MAYSRQTIKERSYDLDAGGLDLAVQSLRQRSISVPDSASESEVRSAVAEIVATALNQLPTLITWWISEQWAAKLVARILDALGDTLLNWLR
jgi:hypothetical protein